MSAAALGLLSGATRLRLTPVPQSAHPASTISLDGPGHLTTAEPSSRAESEFVSEPVEQPVAVTETIAANARPEPQDESQNQPLSAKYSKSALHNTFF